MTLQFHTFVLAQWFAWLCGVVIGWFLRKGFDNMNRDSRRKSRFMVTAVDNTRITVYPPPLGPDNGLIAPGFQLIKPGDYIHVHSALEYNGQDT